MERCSYCNKKLKLINFDCKCGGKFCSSHRYMNAHQCKLIDNMKKKCKDNIKNNNPEINFSNVIKI